MLLSLDSVVEAARRRLAAVTPEVAAYVVLLVTRWLETRPSRVSLGGVLLTDGGDVQVRPELVANEIEMETDLRGVLATLLELSPSLVPAITAVAEAGTGGGLSAFKAELAAALIPINHAAAQRALARLYRETIRAGGLAVDLTVEEAPLPAHRGDTSASQLIAVVALDEASGVIGPNASVQQRREAPLELTAAPSVTRTQRLEGVRELDIDVDLEPESDSESPLEVQRRVPPVAPLVRVVRPAANGITNERRPDHHSDVRELLLHFLSDRRSDERMARTLRALIHLDDCSFPETDGGSTGPP